MSLKTQIQRAATQALKTADSLAVNAQYIQKAAADHTDYDPVAGVLTSAETTATMRAILVSITQEEADRLGLKLSDMKAIWDRKGFTLTVNAEDIVNVLEGQFAGRWEIIRTLQEPSESIFIVGIRRP